MSIIGKLRSAPELTVIINALLLLGVVGYYAGTDGIIVMGFSLVFLSIGLFRIDKTIRMENDTLRRTVRTISTTMVSPLGVQAQINVISGYGKTISGPIAHGNTIFITKDDYKNKGVLWHVYGKVMTLKTKKVYVLRSMQAMLSLCSLYIVGLLLMVITIAITELLIRSWIRRNIVVCDNLAKRMGKSSDLIIHIRNNWAKYNHKTSILGVSLSGSDRIIKLEGLFGVK